MRSPFFMAFMSKAALNTIKSKFFISLEQSLVSSMVEFWLCAQWNWVQSPEVPSHWNSAVSKKNEVDLSQLSWRVLEHGQCSSNFVFCSEKTSHEGWLWPIKKLKIGMRFPWIASKYKSAWWIICNPPGLLKILQLKNKVAGCLSYRNLLERAA